MTREVDQIRREFLNRKELLVGTVIGSARARRFDGTAPGAGVMWVCDVEMGGTRPLLNVPIKAGSDGGRFFANLGSAVVLRRNLAGRFQVIGPGDRAAGEMEIIEYDLVTTAVVTQSSQGFAQVVDPFEFYQGPTAMKGNPNVTFANTGGNDTMDRDAGSFVADGFVAAQSVKITSPLNSATLTLATVGVGQVDFVGDPFVNEGPIDRVRMGVVGTSRWNDGATSFPSRRIEDADGNTITPS